MLDTGPDHPVTFRREAAEPFFLKYVKTSESCVLVGLPGSGLQRFVDFLTRPDTQMHYLGAQLSSYPDAPLLLKVNCKRVTELSEWGLSELLLTTLVEGCNLRPQTVSLQPELKDLRMDVILHKNDILAQRHLEQAVDIFIQRANHRLYFLLSEFDELYKNLPEIALDHLRALRNQHKYAVNYAMCLHQYPELLRPDADDQLSAWMAHNVITVGHYSQEDAGRMIDQLEARKDSKLPPPEREKLLELSGRHAGLISALFTHMTASASEPGSARWEAWLENASPVPSAVLAQCRHIWDELEEEEQQALVQLQHGMPLSSRPIQQLLTHKQLITQHEDQPAIFSPLFARFVHMQGTTGADQLSVDEQKHTITLGTRVISKFSKSTFQLLAYLYRNKGRVCEKDEIIRAIYGDNAKGISEQALSNLVKRARQDLNVSRPQRYLHTVHGVGFQLFDIPQNDDDIPLDKEVI